MTMRDKPGDSVVNGLSSPAKTDNHTVLVYIYHIFIVKVGKAGKGLAMRDIPGEWFVKLSQDRYSYDNKI